MESFSTASSHETIAQFSSAMSASAMMSLSAANHFENSNAKYSTSSQLQINGPTHLVNQTNSLRDNNEQTAKQEFFGVEYSVIRKIIPTSTALPSTNINVESIDQEIDLEYYVAVTSLKKQKAQDTDEDFDFVEVEIESPVIIDTADTVSPAAGMKAKLPCKPNHLLPPTQLPSTLVSNIMTEIHKLYSNPQPQTAQTEPNVVASHIPEELQITVSIDETLPLSDPTMVIHEDIDLEDEEEDEASSPERPKEPEPVSEPSVQSSQHEMSSAEDDWKDIPCVSLSLDGKRLDGGECMASESDKIILTYANAMEIVKLMQFSEHELAAIAITNDDDDDSDAKTASVFGRLMTSMKRSSTRSILNEVELKEVQFPFLLANVHYNEANETHFALIKTIYYSLMKSTQSITRHGRHWDRIGFQGDDPRTDLNRSMGILSLLQVSNLIQDKAALADLMFKISHIPEDTSSDNRQYVGQWPFMCVSIGFTKLTLQALRRGDLTTIIHDWKKTDVDGAVEGYPVDSIMSVLNAAHAAICAYFCIELFSRPNVHHAVILSDISNSADNGSFPWYKSIKKVRQDILPSTVAKIDKKRLQFYKSVFQKTPGPTKPSNWSKMFLSGVESDAFNGIEEISKNDAALTHTAIQVSDDSGQDAIETVPAQGNRIRSSST